MAKGFIWGTLLILSFILGVSFLSINIKTKNLATGNTQKQNNEKIKILIYPGHEPEYGGAEFNKIKERDLNLLLSEKIKNVLVSNPKFEVTMVRDSVGWNPVIKNYVSDNKEEIKTWVEAKKAEMYRLVDEGKFTLVSAEMGHRATPIDPAIFMYGVNKWAGENKIKATIHIHFNNNPKYKGQPNFAGFVIYTPEKQYANASSSKILADSIATEIAKIQKVSTMPAESGGVVEDQELIALGSYNTSSFPVVLAEYAYIYEPLMTKEDTRNIFIDQAASSTAQALENFFR
ncbi:MAG: N-acetylmuramoyl-L-alanine amidase [Candidatus Vogelbacteria bacterium]|nr:N-acetylmuramoyl-L-alanine amidase [Candidatus Vogelbacteria bacterium]